MLFGILIKIPGTIDWPVEVASQKGTHASTQTDLLAVQQGTAAGFGGGAHLLLLVHLLACVERVLAMSVSIAAAGLFLNQLDL